MVYLVVRSLTCFWTLAVCAVIAWWCSFTIRGRLLTRLTIWLVAAAVAATICWAIWHPAA
jgi:hypothetical protein